MQNNFAIAGCGRISQRHAQQIAGIGKLKAVSDIIPERADILLPNQYSATPYYSLEQLLKAERDIDVISIYTPNGLHAEHSILSLQKGMQVICEKLMRIATADGIKMIRAVENSSEKLFMPALSGEKNSVTDGADAPKTVAFTGKTYQQIHL